MKRKKIIYCVLATFVLATISILSFKLVNLSDENEILQDRCAILMDSIKYQKEEITKYKADSLSEWDMFQMALMWVESRYDTTAVSSGNAKGAYQITSIYIKEVNNNHGTNYTPNDAFDFEKSYDIFHKMQETHNPDFSIERAIELHNGSGGWYEARVKSVMETIRSYEKMRMNIRNKGIAYRET